MIEIPESYSPPLQRVLGVKMAIGDDGEGIAWVDIDPEKHYGNQWAHGGLVGTLADVASGIAIARHVGNAYTAIIGTVELKVNFLRKAVDGDLTATARVVHLGKRLAVTEVNVTNKADLCAHATATFMLREDRDGQTT